VKKGGLLVAGSVVLGGVLGCSANVASLKVAIPRAVSVDLVRTATSRGIER